MDVKPGDLVKAVDSAGNLIDSEIVGFLHKNVNSSGKKLTELPFRPIKFILSKFFGCQAMFQVISDSRIGRSISLTSSHLIMSLDRGYVNAGSIKLNERLRVYSRDSELIEMRVDKIEWDVRTGFVAPLTSSGTLLVNDVDASCYAEVNDHYLADMAMTPVKWWFRLKKSFSSFPSSSSSLQTSIPNDVDVNTYSNVLYKVASLFFASYLV